MRFYSKLGLAMVFAAIAIGTANPVFARMPSTASSATYSSNNNSQKAPSKQTNTSGSFGISKSSAGNSRDDIAMRVQQRENEKKQQAAMYAQQQAAARQQEAYNQAQQAKQAQSMAAARAQQDYYAAQRAREQAQQDRYAAERERDRAAQERYRAEQDRINQAELNRQLAYRTQRALEEDARRRARDAAIGGAAVGGIAGYELGKHSQPQNQPYPYPQSTRPTLDPQVAATESTHDSNTSTHARTMSPVQPAVQSQSASSLGWLFWVVVLGLLGGGIYWFIRYQDKKTKSTATPFVAPSSVAPSSSMASVKEPATSSNLVNTKELEAEMIEFFMKLTGYYNTKNAQALTAMTSPQMLAEIKNAFVSDGFVETEYSNVSASIEEVSDESVVVYFEADYFEPVKGNARLKEVWNIKKDTYGYILDGINAIE